MKRFLEGLSVFDIPKFQSIGLSVSPAIVDNLQSSIAAKDMLWDEYDKFHKSLREKVRPDILREIRLGIRNPPSNLEQTLYDAVDYYLWDTLDYMVAKTWAKSSNTTKTEKWCPKGQLLSSAGTFGIAFHPNGWLLSSAHRDGSLRIWDIYSEEILCTIEESMRTTCVAFSPDGNVLAIGGYKGICLRDKFGRNNIGRLNGHSDWVQSIAFSPDSKQLVSGGADGTVRLWDLAAKEECRTIQVPNRRFSKEVNPVKSVAFSPDGSLVAAGDSDGVVRLWDTSGRSLKTRLFGTPTSEFKNHAGSITKLGFCLDGKTLAAIDSVGIFSTRNLVSGKGQEIKGSNITANPFWTPITTLAISPFPELIAVSWTDSTQPKLLLLEPNTHRAISLLDPPSLKCTDMCFSPNGRYLAIATDYGEIHLLQIR